ncbi:hypothetical protein D3C71_1689890 [compost metagenome]
MARADLRDHLARLRRFLLHPQSVFRCQTGHRRRPDVHARQNGHGQPRRHLPDRLRHRPIHLGHPRRPLRASRGGTRRLADFGGRRAGDGHLRHVADLRYLHVDSRLGAVHRLVGAVQEPRQFLSLRATWASPGVVEFLLRLWWSGGLAVCRLVGVYAHW